MTYKLYYFAGRGAGEIARQVFAVAGQDYEDIRYTQETWPQHKAEMPFGQMPVLEVDGKKLPQSGAIVRFLSRKFGLVGKTPLEEAQVDAVADQIKDYMNEIRPFFIVLVGFGQGDLLKKDVLVPARDKHFAIFTKVLKDNKTGYLVGDSLTFADLALAELSAVSNEKMPEFLDNFPEVKAHSEKVRSNPNLKKWLESRPVTPW